MMWLLLLLLVPLLWLFPYIRQVILIRRADKLEREKVKKREEQERKEREKKNQECQKFAAEKDEKILFMQNLGLEEVIGVYGQLWIRREDSKIKELYDLEGNRVPLADLAIAPGTKIIGIVPDLYYYGEKISRWQMLEDEAEIRKLNNA